MEPQFSNKKLIVVNKSSQESEGKAPKYVFVKRKNFVAPIEQRECKTCHKVFDLTREFFGNTPSGNFRWQCRSCMRNHVKSYSEKNPNAAKNRADLRKEREGDAKPIDAKDVDYLLRKYQNQCAYCGVVLDKNFHAFFLIKLMFFQFFNLFFVFFY